MIESFSSAYGNEPDNSALRAEETVAARGEARDQR